MTTILLAPLHRAAVLAKQVASLDALSAGRLTLGLGVGIREDDFQAASVPFHLTKSIGKHRKGNDLGYTMYPSRPNTTSYTQRQWM
jgi:alkanesulfonate monooxygenase SsuD/methylene tetrahydromethanopterin reductase-like flavin-dependent oxidoreductase (luciferase family)